MTLFFTPHDVTNYEHAKTSDTGLYARYFKLLLDGGVYLAPSQFEAAFVSYAHSEDDLLFTCNVISNAFTNLLAD
jgi:glutamate-1-semialdehyde 2,1-aminomutase